MRRDHFTVATANLDPATSDSPALDIQYDGPTETLTEQLSTSDEGVLTAGDIDAAYRFQADPDESEAVGVFSLTNRVTGEYLLECNVAGDDVLDLVEAARAETEDDASYQISIYSEADDPIVYDLNSLLVYDPNGNLLRQHSLIPSGVEL